MWVIDTFKNNKNKEIHYFPTCLFQFRVMGGETPSQQLRVQGETQPWTGHPSIAGQTYTHTYTHSDMLVYLTSTSLGCGRKRVPRGNPLRHKENMQTPHSGLAGNRVFSHQCYKETTLNKMKLFKELSNSYYNFKDSKVYWFWI